MLSSQTLDLLGDSTEYLYVPVRCLCPDFVILFLQVTSEDVNSTIKTFFCPNDTYNDMATLFFNSQESAILQLFHQDGECLCCIPPGLMAAPTRASLCNGVPWQRFTFLPPVLKDDWAGVHKLPWRTHHSFLSLQASASVTQVSFHPAGTFSPITLALFFILYFLLACWTFGTSVPSGLFVPSLLCGAAFGRLVANVLKR